MQTEQKALKQSTRSISNATAKTPQSTDNAANKPAIKPNLLSIITPMLNEAQQLPALLAHLQKFQQKGCEIILVDGGSTDGSIELASAQFEVMTAPAGRARQMNAGARKAQAENLLFLHADTRLPANADRLILDVLQQTNKQWGRFDVTILGKSKMLPMVSWFMNKRSRLSGIATGDQAIFVTRSAFYAVSAFPDQPLMEDIEISRHLRKLSSPVCLFQKVTTSGRRWDQRGSWHTIFLMWRLRWAYWRGESAETLASLYR
ncbi:MAG: TIGR04283 family arsenosugar biosynthesis glycosyltransferase [Pseudomonadales bacterium]|nr:TIGR04283 family arsenosugar biosynthesis glycosyltransferase [Pseudomonadales bacterium]